MANVLVEEHSLIAIANAIRQKNGLNTTYKPSEMDDAINNLATIENSKWIRPSNWPDYSKVDISNEEVIYLTYNTTREDSYISVRAYNAYTIQRGSLNNGIFTPISTTNCNAGEVFQEPLPTDEGEYIVYKITPQSGQQLTRFAFARWDDIYSSIYYYGQLQPCVERYCRLPNWVGTKNRSPNQYIWTTRYLEADTILDATPTGGFNDAYNDGGQLLKKVDMSTCSFSEVTSIANLFNYKQQLCEVLLPHDLSSKCTNASSAFNECICLKFLDLTGWDTSGITQFQSMFYDCRSLIEIKGIEDFDVSSATNISKMFQQCYEIQELDISKWQTSSSLTTMNDVFHDCRSISELNVSGFNTSNVTNFTYAIGGCTELKSIDLSNWIISTKCTSLSHLFGYNYSMEKVIRNLNWDTSNVTTFEGMFRECKSIKEIDLSDFNFSKATTIRYMFPQCQNLEKVKVTFNLPKVTARANVANLFENCWKLKDLSNISFTNCKFMPGFAYSYSIEEIVAPSTVTALGETCLRDLQHCRIIDFTNLSVVPTLSSTNDVLSGYNNQIKFIVPDNLYSSWITSTNWSNATIATRTFTNSDYSLYKGESENISQMDLSDIEWVRNYSYSQNSAVGTAYASMVSIGTTANAKRIASGLIDFPDADSILISFNPGYSCTVLFFDGNGKYLKNYLEWNTSPILVHPTTNINTQKIALFVRLGDGSKFLYPEDWELSGIDIKYVRR